MKKIFIAFLIIASTCIITSCINSANNKLALTVEQNTSPFKKDVGTAD